jgi:CDP-2,3-bis-(O-geranylgeranyl)-sn-glycerol synthase
VLELQRKDMFKTIFTAFWFFLPAGAANVAPVLFKWLPLFNMPVDFNKKIKGKPLFGENKTIRGLIVGLFFSILFVWLEAKLYPYFSKHLLIDYREINFWILGLLLGGGALLGDLTKSFFKRQFGIAEGKMWVPFDQLDWIIGGLFLSVFYVNLSWQTMVVIVILFGLLHPLVNLLGFALGIKKSKF